MKLIYYVLHIETNRYDVDVKLFMNILEEFHVIFATCRGGFCKALCEDSENMKLYTIYQLRNACRYEGVHVE